MEGSRWGSEVAISIICDRNGLGNYRTQNGMEYVRPKISPKQTVLVS